MNKQYGGIRKIFFLSKGGCSELFSEYLKVFQDNNFETWIFDLKPLSSKKEKLKYIISLSAEIKNFKPDFVYIGLEFTSKNILFAALLRKILGLRFKIITYVASQYIPQYRLSREIIKQKKLRALIAIPLNRIKLHFLLKNIDFLFCRNRKELKKIKGLPLFENYSGLYQIYLGVPEKFFHKIHQSREEICRTSDVLKKNYFKIKNKYVLGFIGRLVPEKGLHVLLGCLKKLPSNFVLLIAGKGENEDYQNKIKSFIKKNHLGKRVIFLNSVKSEELKYVYNVCDLVVMPTTKRYNNFRELFGSVIAESMLCKTMIIGSENGSIPEVIGRKDLIFKESDLEDLLRAINYISNLKHKEKEKILTENYQRAHQKYNAEAFVKTIIKAISVL